MHNCLRALGQAKYQHEFTDPQFHAESLELPLRWHKQKRIFVDSMSDLFHEAFTLDHLLEIWAVMRATPRHTYQVVTKRPELAAELLSESFAELLPDASDALAGRMGWCHADGDLSFPLSNLQLIATCENQTYAERRIRWLFQCQAAVRGVSLEPLLGPIDLTNLSVDTPTGTEQWDALETEYDDDLERDGPKLDWVIVGCESGPGRRPCDPEWVISIVSQCRRAGVPVFIEQMSINGRVTKKLWEFPVEAQVRMYPGDKWAASELPGMGA
jgi:protein gp37